MLQNYPIYAYIPARDVARARKFYEDKLGLKPQRDMGDGVAYKLGDHTAAFLYDAGDSAGTNRASQAFWQVEDVEREVAQLRSKGVKFEHYEPKDIGGLTMKGDIAEGDGMKVAWFKDTEGNIMALVQDAGMKQ